MEEISIVGLFHSQLRSVGTFSVIAMTLYGFSTNLPRLTLLVKLISLGLLFFATWFVINADTQFTQYLQLNVVGKYVEKGNEYQRDVLKRANTWRACTPMLVVLLLGVATTEIFDTLMN